MPKMDDAKSLADSYLDEIGATIEIRQSYNDIVVGQARDLFAAFVNNPEAKTKLKQVLQHKAVDASALYKPLIVQINGIFENYIRSLVKAVIEDRFETVELYSNLEEDFRNDYIVHIGKVLNFAKDGAIMGVPYNFNTLLMNLGRSLANQKGFKLHPEVYTKLMGNCTPQRLTKLFGYISLPDPFSDQLGQNTELKKYFADKAKGRVAQRASETLEKQIDLRNSIVHGDLTLSVDLANLQDTLSFFRALIAALDQLVRV